MKLLSTSSSPLSVPRSGSLLHRLRHAPGGKDESYVDQLMIFLENPPARLRDRWKEGARMCRAWGIPCTGASVWRFYRSHVLEWRLRLAPETCPDATEGGATLEEKIERLVALRALEVLANPHSPPGCLVALARIELRKKALDLACQQHQDKRTDLIQLALDTLSHRRLNREAAFALGKLKIALRKTVPSPTRDAPAPLIPAGA